MELIDKAAVVAEITNLKVKYECGWNCAIDKVLEHIDDLEVKEVNSYEDLDKEIQYMYKRDNSTLKTEKQYAKYAKHFFELGIKTQKGK